MWDHFKPKPNTVKYCKAVHSLLTERLGKKVGTHLYRLTVSLDACGFWVQRLGHQLEDPASLAPLPLDHFNDYIYSLDIQTCFICGVPSYHSGVGEYYGINSRDGFTRVSPNAYLRLGDDTDYAYDKEDGAPFVVFTVPAPYNVVAFSWTGIHLLSVPGKEDMGASTACEACETDSVGGWVVNRTKALEAESIYFNKYSF